MEAMIYRYILIFGMYNFFLELFIAFLAIMIHYKKRKYFLLRVIICFIVGLASLYLPFFMIGRFNGSYTIILLIVNVMGLFLYKTSFKNIIINSITAFALQHLFWNILFIIYELIGYDNVNETLALTIYFVLYIILYAVLFFIMLKHPQEKETKNLDFRILISSIGLIFLVVIISNYVDWTVYSRIYALICCLFGIMLQMGILDISVITKKKKMLEQEKNVLENLIKQQSKQQKISKETIDIINMKCHDMKNQIEILKHLSSSDQQANFEQIEKAINIYGDIATTENETMNIVLTEKSLICNNNQIKFTYMIDGENMAFIKPVDLSFLFGNILDNAIDAQLKEQAENRIIRLNVSRKQQFLCIHMENYCSRKVKFIDGLPLTNKKDKTVHGYGIKSIKYIVEKYEGSLNFNVEDNLFKVNIIIPIP